MRVLCATQWSAAVAEGCRAVWWNFLSAASRAVEDVVRSLREAGLAELAEPLDSSSRFLIIRRSVEGMLLRFRSLESSPTSAGKAHLSGFTKLAALSASLASCSSLMKVAGSGVRGRELCELSPGLLADFLRASSLHPFDLSLPLPAGFTEEAVISSTIDARTR